MREFFGDLKIAETAFGAVRKNIFIAIFLSCFLGISFLTKSDFLSGASISILPLAAFFGPSLAINHFSGKNYLVASFLPIKAENMAGIIFFSFDIICITLFLCSGIISIVAGSAILFLDLVVRILFCCAMGYICICSYTRFALADTAMFGWKLSPAPLILYLVLLVISVLQYIAFDMLDKERWFVIIILIFIALFLPTLIFIRQKMLKKTLIKMRGTKNGF
ncbi:MAG: hypothetical protein JG769_1470 [Oscillospiraceae bacterium]|jgi:hypothetical protein|nr:hypothetical protein [Oscillospiraceae bacterium]